MRLNGIFAALVTPLTSQGEVNLDVVGELFDFVTRAKISGISVLGSTGEYASLSPQIRKQMVNETIRLSGGRTLVAAGIAESSTEAAIAQINAFADIGLKLVLLCPPFYYSPNQEEIMRFYEAVADRTPLPLILYNIPSFTKFYIEPSTVAKLAKNPKIRGIKDSSRNFDYLQTLLTARNDLDDFSILTGSDSQLFAALAAGADGAWAASLNIAPYLDPEIFSSVAEKDWQKAQQLQRILIQIVDACRRGTFPAGWKAACESIGIKVGAPAFPTLPLQGEDLKRLSEQIRVLGISRERTSW